jgi:hypothetical protein
MDAYVDHAFDVNCGVAFGHAHEILKLAADKVGKFEFQTLGNPRPLVPHGQICPRWSIPDVLQGSGAQTNMCTRELQSSLNCTATTGFRLLHMYAPRTCAPGRNNT